MEHVDGGSLLDKCREGAIPLEDAVELTCQLCSALDKTHNAGMPVVGYFGGRWHLRGEMMSAMGQVEETLADGIADGVKRSFSSAGNVVGIIKIMRSYAKKDRARSRSIRSPYS